MTDKADLYLIDGSSYIYRAFFAIKQYLSNSRGLPTNAIYGFTLMLLRIFREEKPDYLAVTFDSHGKTFRHVEYREYKAHRPEMPAELIPQIPYIHKLVKSFNLAVFQKEGFEADDLIGTIARRAEAKGFRITIVSGDKDLMQLIGSQIRMLDTLKNKIYAEKEVVEKFGVAPERIVEVMGLMGDAADNIPGVPGIGKKGAADLIRRFGSIENLLQNLEKIEKTRIKESLKKYREQAILSRRLSKIITDLDLELYLGELQVKEPNREELISLFKELEFSSLLKNLNLYSPEIKKDYRVILEKEEFEKLILSLKTCSLLSLDLETNHEEPLRAEIVGISFCYQENRACYLPLLHQYPGVPEQLSRDYVLSELKAILENSSLKKIGQNIKYDTLVFSNYGIELRGIVFDTMLAAYLLNPAKHNHNLGEISLEYLGRPLIPFKELVGRGKKQKSFSAVTIAEATDYACQDSEVVFQLLPKLEPLLKKEELETLFKEVEMPLIKVLVEMERKGIGIDQDFLRKFSSRLDKELQASRERIYFIAGEEFNLNSPKQLAEILFNKLQLKPGKKTKTGFSTDVQVLEELSRRHDLPAELLNYRQLNKLKSTYVEGLIAMINPLTGRIHTSFNQTVTATGRLSSSNPNLQNIPIRAKLGKEIRKAFVAGKGRIILSADYSQIELRILAHFSANQVLIESFNQGEDIHRRTASEIIGLSPELVTQEMRRMAKTINFGIIYGMSPYGLARDLNTSPKEAKRFIDNYFSRYNGVKEYIVQTIELARRQGFVSTILKRKRYLPDLKSRNKSMREFAERTAINTTIQGSAADIIKLAMISISREIKKKGLESKMILQVHDELVFELPQEEKDELKTIVKERMENVLPLSVPLRAEIYTGKNWHEAD